MPVTTSTPIETYVLIDSSLDFSIPAQNVVFSHRINGVEVGRVPFQIAGAAFTALFGSPAPDTTTPLATVIQEAIYNTAIAARVFSGTVTPG